MTRLLTLAFVLLAVPALAQERGRYVYTPTEDGALRLDVETGEVARCDGMAKFNTCTPLSADAASQRKVARLERRIDELEERVETLESRTLRLPDIDLPKAELPDEEEIDRALDLAERAMRRFFGIARELKEDMRGERI